MKRTTLAISLILALLISAVAGTLLINLGRANPYLHRDVYEEVPPPNGTKPPTVSISSPENNTAHASNNISLTFNVSQELILSEIYYQESWHNNPSEGSIKNYVNFSPTISINLTDVPEGPHWVTISATGTNAIIQKQYPVPPGALVRVHHISTYHLTTHEVVIFTIDTVAPNVSILTLQNRTYSKPDVLMDFAVNEEFSQVAYSLDCKDNVTVAGNSTLSDLSVGEHNVTVYAWDVAGNLGASETLYFSVEAPFPIVPLASASMVAVTIVGVGLLLFKNRKHQCP